MVLSSLTTQHCSLLVHQDTGTSNFLYSYKHINKSKIKLQKNCKLSCIPLSGGDFLEKEKTAEPATITNNSDLHLSLHSVQFLLIHLQIYCKQKQALIWPEISKYIYFKSQSWHVLIRKPWSNHWRKHWTKSWTCKCAPSYYEIAFVNTQLESHIWNCLECTSSEHASQMVQGTLTWGVLEVMIPCKPMLEYMKDC